MSNLKTVLVIDGGGRGAVLVDKYGQSQSVGRILVVPGNDLMAINTSKDVITYPNLKTTSIKEILEIVEKEDVNLVDVAQDNAVEAGLVNELEKLGIAVIGPTKEAGQIEWDKAWARNFMKKYGIPSPEYHVFNSEEAGLDFIKKNPGKKWFIKAAGLAEGKGVIPAENFNKAIKAIKEMSKFGKAGETYLLEEWLEGEEFSAFALCDGGSFKLVGCAQDHKRVNDGDKGLNTGGMGCVSNPKVVTKYITSQINQIFKKTIEGLNNERRPYKGILYLGGMVLDKKVSVIEFNARWGDHEAHVILPSIQNDIYKVSMAIVSESLKQLKIRIDENTIVVVAGTSKGYPGDYSKVKGKKVFGISEVQKIEGIKIYGAGIKKSEKNWVVNGGRVLYIAGEGKNIIDARKKAYGAMALISIEGNNLHYRSDIGFRDLERLRK